MPDDPAVTIGYRDLLLRLDDGEEMVRPEGATKRYAIKDLLDGIEDAQTRATRAEHLLAERDPVEAKTISPPQTDSPATTSEREPTRQKQPHGWRIAFAILAGTVLTGGLLGWRWWHWQQTGEISYRFIATSLVAIWGISFAIAKQKGERAVVLAAVILLLIELGIGLLPE